MLRLALIIVSLSLTALAVAALAPMPGGSLRVFGAEVPIAVVTVFGVDPATLYRGAICDLAATMLPLAVLCTAGLTMLEGGRLWMRLRRVISAAGFFCFPFALPLLAASDRLLGRVDGDVLNAVVLALVQGMQVALWPGVLGGLFRSQRSLALLGTCALQGLGRLAAWGRERRFRWDCC